MILDIIIWFKSSKCLQNETLELIDKYRDNFTVYSIGFGNDYGLVNQVYNNGSKVSFDVAREAGAIIDTKLSYKDIFRPE